MPRVPLPGGSRRDALIDQVARAPTATDVFAVASPRLRALVPFDAAAWVGADPATGLPTSPVRIDDLDGVSQAMCSDHWQHELLADDVNRFRDLARARTPAAALRATAGDVGRSRRYRRFLRPLGLSDELRVALCTGDALWGTITLWRGEGQEPFTPSDTALASSLATPVARALRRHLQAHGTPDDPAAAECPGLLRFDRHGRLVSIDDAARAWLDELPPDAPTATGLGIELPVWLLVLVFRAGGVRRGLGDGSATTRVMTRHGRWLSCTASCLRRGDGSFDDTIVVIERAPAATVAPVVAAAYGLTPREHQIVGHIARGRGTDEIAAAVFVSPHTVRDHVKAVLAKVGVSSRGELVARIYADFYEPDHHAGVVRAES